MSIPLLLETIKKEVLTLKSFLVIIFISFIYFSFSTLILNYKLLTATFLGSYEMIYKITLAATLLLGSWTAFSHLDFFFLIITSFLVGINTLLVIKLLMNLKKQNAKVNLSLGGSSVIGVVTAGCSSCGFSILSIMGLSASLSFIPFGGLTLHILTISLLSFSIYYSLKTIYYSLICKLN